MNRLCLATAAALTLAAVGAPASAALLYPVQSAGGNVPYLPYQEPQPETAPAEETASTQEPAGVQTGPSDGFAQGDQQQPHSNPSSPPGLGDSENERFEAAEKAARDGQQQTPRPGRYTSMRPPRGDGSPPKIDPRGVRQRLP